MAHFPFISWTTMTVTKIILFIYLFSPVISFNASLLLERAFPHKGIEISMLHMFDNQRHLGMDNDTGVPHFNLSGSVALGLYYAKVNFGTPAKAFHVQVDTGSDLFWVSCSTCKNCPKYSQLGIVKFFTPESSLTASSIGCYQSFCPHKHLGIKTSCLKGNLCGYTSSYADTIDTLGYFVSDVMRFDITYENDTTATFSTNIIFGCTTSLTGFPTSRGPADGIIGLGHSEVSILSQLASHEEVPKIFSHCLVGEGSGGGVLVFGEILEEDLIYTPLVPTRSHYNVDVEGIAINGQNLPIDPKVFKSSRYRGAIFDSGSTFVSLIDEAYTPFANNIKTALSHLVPVTGLGSDLCYESSTSKVEDFPIITFNFAGHATMNLKPEDYLVEGIAGLIPIRCIGIRKTVIRGATIIGDIALKDKIIVYDLVEKRIGWKYCNCSSHISLTVNKTHWGYVGNSHGNNITLLIIAYIISIVFCF